MPDDHKDDKSRKPDKNEKKSRKRKEKSHEKETGEPASRKETTVGGYNRIRHTEDAKKMFWTWRANPTGKKGHVPETHTASSSTTSASSSSDILLLPVAGPSRHSVSDQARHAEPGAHPRPAPQASQASAAANNAADAPATTHTYPADRRLRSTSGSSAPAFTSTSSASPGPSSARAPSQSQWHPQCHPHHAFRGNPSAGSTYSCPPLSRPRYMDSVPEQSTRAELDQGMANFDPMQFGGAQRRMYPGPPQPLPYHSTGDISVPVYTGQHGSPPYGASMGDGLASVASSRSRSHSASSAPGNPSRMYAPSGDGDASPSRARGQHPYPMLDERSHMRARPPNNMPGHHIAQPMHGPPLSAQSYPPMSTIGITSPGAPYHNQGQYLSQPALGPGLSADYAHWDPTGHVQYGNLTPRALQPSLPPSAALSQASLPLDTPLHADQDITPRSLLAQLPPDTDAPFMGSSYTGEYNAHSVPMSADMTGNAFGIPSAYPQGGMAGFPDMGLVAPWEFEPPAAGALEMWDVPPQMPSTLPHPGSNEALSAGLGGPWSFQAGPSVLTGGPPPMPPQSPRPRQGHHDGRSSVMTPELRSLLFRGPQVPWGGPRPRAPGDPDWESMSWEEIVEKTRVDE